MTDRVVVLVTCENAEEAKRIAETVVSEKLAACVNLVSGVRSCYVWEGKMTWSDEVLAIIKTTKGRYDQLETRIRGMHTYQVPEIVSLTIEDGFDKYLEWIDRSVGG